LIFFSQITDFCSFIFSLERDGLIEVILAEAKIFFLYVHITTITTLWGKHKETKGLATIIDTEPTRYK